MKYEIFLERFIDERAAEFIEAFKDYEFEKFSHEISLQEYQQRALKNAIIALRLFYKENLIYPPKKDKGEFETNRASFWMATGSGKTLVMIKLMSLLFELMEANEIPKKPIMLLAPNDKILSQFKERTKEFNAAHTQTLEFVDLKDYESTLNAGLFKRNLVYFTRSDLLDTKENVGRDKKAKRLNHADFERDEGWYILLDEAHRGDSSASVRKGYINTLARGLRAREMDLFSKKSEIYKMGGFIFNFSATFEDEVDINSCAFNYNLEAFNKDGFGKNIAVLKSDLKAFSSKNLQEVQIERIIESFIVFSAIKESKKALFEKFKALNLKKNLSYHQPLIIAVSDKVNTDDAGIRTYFKAINSVLKNEVANFTQIKENLLKMLENLELYYDKNVKFSEKFLEFIKNADLNKVRENVFYAKEISACEACKIRTNAKEMAFKSKNAKKPFMLLNIGDAKPWEKELLNVLEIELGEDLQQSYFESINSDESPINIMLGSKIFSEGWDSNRVNFINFINIGSKDAVKYVLQTIGRGVRIEPFKHQRKRLEKIENVVDFRDFGLEFGLETLFISASDKDAVEKILKGLQDFKKDDKHKIKAYKQEHFEPLYVPIYEQGEENENRKYKMSEVDFDELGKFVREFDEDVLLFDLNIRREDMGFSTLQRVRDKNNFDFVSVASEFIDENAAKRGFKTIDSFFHEHPKRLKKYKNISDEIVHFEGFEGNFGEDEIEWLNKKIKNLIAANYYDDHEKEKQKVNFKKYTLNAKLKKHYYLTIITQKDENAPKDIKHAIWHKSEVEFLDDLEGFLEHENALKAYEWCFSKLVENVDKIFIPYFDSEKQEYRKFYPDFIFWLKHKQNLNYKIIFIDPKGLQNEQNPRDKARAFEQIFSPENQAKIKGENGEKIAVNLVFYNKAKRGDKGELDAFIKSNLGEIFG